MNIGDIAGNILSNLASAGIVALIAYIFRSNIRNFFVEPALKSKVHSPSLSLEIDAVKNTRNQWVTIFLLENTGDVDVSDLRVFLCSYGLASGSLLIEPIKIEDQRKWINDAGQRIQINTLSLHEGCNLTEDQRFFVEFTDGNGGTIYRMSRGSPSPRDGKLAVYGTGVCRKRLPRKRLQTRGNVNIEKIIKKYDIDLAVG